jgi:hypothetical protein
MNKIPIIILILIVIIGGFLFFKNYRQKQIPKEVIQNQETLDDIERHPEYNTSPAAKYK